jgi:hypothetical protein
MVFTTLIITKNRNMSFKIGEDVVCIAAKFNQVYGKANQFAHPKKDEIVTIVAFKENWIQLKQYPTNNGGLPLFFSQDKFRKLTDADLALSEELKELEIIEL